MVLKKYENLENLCLGRLKKIKDGGIGKNTNEKSRGMQDLEADKEVHQRARGCVSVTGGPGQTPPSSSWSGPPPLYQQPSLMPVLGTAALAE